MSDAREADGNPPADRRVASTQLYRCLDSWVASQECLKAATEEVALSASRLREATSSVASAAEALHQCTEQVASAAVGLRDTYHAITEDASHEHACDPPLT